MVVFITNGRAVVKGGAVIWGFRTDDRKRNRQSITISTLRFESLMTALNGPLLALTWAGFF